MNKETLQVFSPPHSIYHYFSLVITTFFFINERILYLLTSY